MTCIIANSKKIYNKNKVGMRINNLWVLKSLGMRPGGSRERCWYRCRCLICGKLTEKPTCALPVGDKKGRGRGILSCGCLFSKWKVNTNGNPVYNIWKKMNDRCQDPGNPQFHNYGGRGIAVCDEWIKDFNNFYDWSISNGYHRDLSLDRIDNDGPYAPWNCRWATDHQQSRNRRNNVVIEFEGAKLCLVDMSEKYGLPSSVVGGRLRRGWSVEEALLLPLGTRRVKS